MFSLLLKTGKGLLLSIVLVVSCLATVNAQGPKVNWHVIASGGALNIVSGQYLISATIGQPIVGNISIGGYRHFIGFWGPQAIKEEITGVNEYVSTGENSLLSNYPNPFSLQTTISYQVPQSGVLSIRIMDMVGREVRSIISNEFREAGSHNVMWDGKDNVGSDLQSGNFICEMSFSQHGESLKARIPLILVK